MRRHLSRTRFRFGFLFRLALLLIFFLRGSLLLLLLFLFLLLLSLLLLLLLLPFLFALLIATFLRLLILLLLLLILLVFGILLLVLLLILLLLLLFFLLQQSRQSAKFLVCRKSLQPGLHLSRRLRLVAKNIELRRAMEIILRALLLGDASCRSEKKTKGEELFEHRSPLSIVECNPNMPASWDLSASGFP